MLKNFDLRQKKVIDCKTAEIIGYIKNMDIDGKSGRINSVFVPKRGFFGILKGSGVTIPWEDIVAIGSEYIIVNSSENKIISENK